MFVISCDLIIILELRVVFLVDKLLLMMLLDFFLFVIILEGALRILERPFVILLLLMLVYNIFNLLAIFLIQHLVGTLIVFVLELLLLLRKFVL